MNPERLRVWTDKIALYVSSLQSMWKLREEEKGGTGIEGNQPGCD